MALYILDKELGANGIALAGQDTGAKVMLIQDGVYLDLGPLEGKSEVFAIKDDVDKRGLSGKLPQWVKLIGYGEAIDLIVAQKVINFA